MIRFNSFLLLVSSLFLFLGCADQKTTEVSILPKPVNLQYHASKFNLNSQTSIWLSDTSEEMKTNALLFQEIIEKHCGFKPEVTDDKRTSNQVRLVVETLAEKNGEAYNLEIDEDKIALSANKASGLFYGIQTIRQLLPVAKKGSCGIQGLKITDYPRFKWRGLHLDVGRHFFSKDDVKRYIDLMSMYKYNVFHWHLTEDQGWRIEIKKYPKLTEVGAWRNRVGFKRNQELGLDEDNGKRYGGFYTQDEVREIVAYAAQRNITVVPEIEMPGHSQAALVAYPELYCFPDQELEVRLEGGVSDGVYCAGKEKTFQFLEGVLTEVMELFPSKYIHIGGDEAPKQNWQACKLCQQRIKREGLQGEHELQSYFIKRIEKFLHQNNRQLIGWDEILEGGINPSSTIMSWRGMTPGMEAAEAGHDVVMTPGTPCYISHPQSVNPITQTTGGVTTMRDIYEFDPVPKELADEYVSHIIGVQACQWSEGTPNLKVLEYKSYPRTIAMAEVAWTQKAERNYDDFYKRYASHTSFLDFYNVGYGQRSYDVKINIVPGAGNDGLYIDFQTEVPGTVYYTLNGEDPSMESPKFERKIKITENCTVKAIMYKPDGSEGRIAKQNLIIHKAVGKKVKYNIPYSSKHDGGGEYGLTNGMLNRWQGFEKRNVNLVLDMGKSTSISKIKTQWWYDIKDWVFKPQEIMVDISIDGKEFQNIYSKAFETKENVYEKGVLPVKINVDNETARYIRIKARNIMQNPKWHGSAGGGSWIFLDEIIVE